MQKPGKILRGLKDTLAAVVSTLRGEHPRRPSIPTPLVFRCFAVLILTDNSFTYTEVIEARLPVENQQSHHLRRKHS